MNGKHPGLVIQALVKKILTYLRIRKLKRMEKLKKKHPVLDWIEAILWALIIVLLIQQFLFELYVIPTGSMIPEIDIGARVAVEKITFGPEIIPGRIKLPGFRQPRRGEVVMFENPSYPPMNPLLNILHKIIYRLSLTLVDIDKDQYGNPRPRLLLKRVIAIAGDRIRADEHGNMEILPAGESEWVPEPMLMQRLGLDYVIRRNSPAGQQQDFYSLRRQILQEEYLKDPTNQEAREKWLAQEQGWYVPEQMFFPMGDNRDNSRDAREYGPVSTQRLLGRAVLRLWPANHFGLIR